MDSSKKLHLIPPDELRCIWMTAGILSYQLCDRMFDCDNCPLDQAMRRRFPEPAGVIEDQASPLAPAGPQEIPREGFQFSRNHWWTRKMDHGLVRLGIEADLAQALLAVKAIVFPSLQQRLRRGQTCSWAVMEGGTLPLEAPIDGIVRTVNQELIEKPHMLCLHPFDEGWICELEAEDSVGSAAGLMTADEARPKYASDRNRFMASLAGALRRRPTVGLTLADGGEKLQNFADILGPSRYFALVRQSFGWARR